MKIGNLKLKIVVGYLYGDLMNIYGDTGNIIALKKRAQWRGIDVVVKKISIGSGLKKGDCDIFFFGGGQDQQQELVVKDLQTKAKVLREEIEKGVPLLSICGGYQLLGEYYQPARNASAPARLDTQGVSGRSVAGGPHKGPRLEGVGIFSAYTVASFDRMIGNIVIDSQFGKLVGFENHSGKTYLKDAQALGKVKKGYGNNGKDKTEGTIYKNAIGCYMHGSLLPKNPKLADWLLEKALEIKYGKEIKLEALDDNLENEAHKTAISKFS